MVFSHNQSSYKKWNRADVGVNLLELIVRKSRTASFESTRALHAYKRPWVALPDNLPIDPQYVAAPILSLAPCATDLPRVG